jgi:hypothetical protein
MVETSCCYWSGFSRGFQARFSLSSKYLNNCGGGAYHHYHSRNFQMRYLFLIQAN